MKHTHTKQTHERPIIQILLNKLISKAQEKETKLFSHPPTINNNDIRGFM